MDNKKRPEDIGRSNGIGYYAMRLAITQSQYEEEHVKEEYASRQLKVVVTETGGKTGLDFQDKVSRSLIGAALNQGVIDRSGNEIHALFHAAEEAKRGVLVNSTTDTSVAVKIAIVRSEHWISVAMFGTSAIHPLSSHERCGLGVMHI